MKIETIDGVKYQIIECPKCKKELRFKMHKERRRLYCACINCGQDISIEVEAL